MTIKKRKEIDLNELYDYMKENIKKPILRHDFLKYASEYFETTHQNLGFFVKRVIIKSSDFGMISTAVIYPDGKKIEALRLFGQIRNANPNNRKKKTAEYTANKHKKIKEYMSKNKGKSGKEISRELNMGYNTILSHNRNQVKTCKLCKKGDSK